MPGPFRSLVRGLAAGILGSAAQDVFFALTSRLEPRDERAPEEVARRAAALLQRDLPDDRARAGHAVHYAYGSAWGGAYGVGSASFPALRSGAGGAAFGVLVWAASQDVVLPAFRLAAPASRDHARSRLYSLAAHLVYGITTGLALEAMTPKRPAPELVVRASERAPEPVHLRVQGPDMLEGGAGI